MNTRFRFFLVIIIISLVLSSCSTEDRIDKFINVGEDALEFINYTNTADESELYERYMGMKRETLSFKNKIQSILKEISSVAKNSMYKKEFYIGYLETYSSDSFVKYIQAMTYVSYEWEGEGGKGTRKELKKILDRFCETSGHKFVAMTYEKIKNDTGSFYSENPKAIPQEETHVVRGKFNKPDGSIYEKEVTGKTTVQYYGDYAIAYTNTYKYDDGTYGWYDGEFIDIPASFKPWVYYCVFYKGSLIIREDSLNDLKQALNNYEAYLSNDGVFYYLSDWAKNDDDFCIYILNTDS